MSTLLLFIAIISASYAWGIIFLRVLKLPADDAKRDVFALAIGWGILAYITMGVAAIGLLKPIPITFVLVGSLFLCIGRLKNIYLSARAVLSSLKSGWEGMGTIERALCGILIWIFLFNILDILAPPSVADSLSYHFRIPYDYIKAGKLVYNPFLPYNAPHLTEIYSSLSFLFNNEIAAHAQFYFFNIVLAFAIILFAQKYFNRIVGLLSCVIFFSLPMITDIKSAGYVEVALTLVTFTGLWALIEGYNAEQDHQSSWFVLAGSLIGLACGIKYYGLFNVLILPTLLSFITLRDIVSRNSRSVYNYLYFLFAVLIFASPFYIKNVLFTGNPFYPAFHSLFGGIDWSAEFNQLFKQMAREEKMPLGHGIGALFMSPINITMKGMFIAGKGNEYGPLYIALFPLFFSGIFKSLYSRQKKIILWAAVYIAFFWCIWFYFAFQRGRHLLPAFLLITVFLSAFIVKLFDHRDTLYKWWKYGVVITLVICLGFNLAVHVIFNAQFFKVAFGVESRETFLSRKLKFFKDIEWANHNLPPKAKVLNYIGDHNYYLKRDMMYPSSHFQGHFDFFGYKTIDEYYHQLKAEGFTHIITKYSDIDIDTVVAKANGNDPQIAYTRKYLEFHHELIGRFGKEIYKRRGLASTRRTFSEQSVPICAAIFELR